MYSPSSTNNKNIALKLHKDLNYDQSIVPTVTNEDFT